MKRRSFAVCIASMALSTSILALDGRWEGHAEVPGGAVAVIVDVVSVGPSRRGFVTLPGRGIAKAPLTSLDIAGDGLRGAIAPGPGASEADALRLTLRSADAGRSLVGQLHQGGHTVALRLQRTGDAPVPDAIPAAPVPAALHGTWRGRYDMGFGPREATLRLSAQQSSLTVVGRRTTEIGFDDAAVRGALLMLRANRADLSIEAPAAGAAQGVWRATIRQGPFETALELRREGGAR